MDQEIDKLTEGVMNIRNLMRDINDVAIQQGEVVDRIDFNIETAMKHVVKGKKNLVEAREYQENGCARWCIKMQLIAVMILGILIFIKYR